MCRRTIRPIPGAVSAIIASVLVLALAPRVSPAFGQISDTLSVTVADKTSAHPEAGTGFPEGYVVDGQQGKSVAVVRGRTYTFQMENVPAIHPFYITTSSEGLGAEPYDDGVTNNFASENEVLTLEVGESTPDVLYYQCQNHANMGWRIYVFDEASAGLETVADGLTSPVALAQPEDGTGRLFIVDQAGQIRVVSSDGLLLDQPFLDLSDRIVELNTDFDERGLLGLAFHPNYAENGRFFVYYSAPLRAEAPDGWDNTSTISEFQVSETDPDQADPNSERILLEVDQPQFNHAGGTVVFGPDGYLYISLGDGGGANDVGEGHASDWYAANEGGNAQNVESTLLGKILRLDVDEGSPYGVPDDNPFVGRDGADEIFAYGLRNPYRMSFDMSGELGLLAGDAGQNRWEEVSQIEPGGNYGWNVKEGTHCFSTDNPNEDAEDCPDEVGAGHPDAGAPLIGPVVEYKNANQESGVGLAVVGGVLYRGDALPALQGRYVFGDWSYDSVEPEGLLFVATPADEGRWPMQPLLVDGREEGELHEFVLGFGKDASGEAYLLTSESPGPTGSSGKVYRLIAPTDVARESDGELPNRVRLEQNFPNPFNPSTTLRFELPRDAHVTIHVYDMTGRVVATLADRWMSAGHHSITWDGHNDAGQEVPSGAYLYRVETEEGRASRIMTLVR